eukprot:CAMPEP_0196583752 /NCGR_PEP_ID=MMETSP1081-20130531/44530_1 /TAXON_ID=36882 /ORGANISM="Pyramimonas amylifera, Strain CCMP720" /LENGTH=102 /DNA_ID=CAMNT_0041904725 /DNA_START=41 /DNA_END=345 /DNA_ORIENTATION=-
MASDGTTHPNAVYNKQNLGALVGNWYEESALEAATGSHRYKTWVPLPDPNDKTVYAAICTGPEFIPTNERMFVHTTTEDDQRRLYQTHNQDVHRHPSHRAQS